jgi:hypothetical protein
VLEHNAAMSSLLLFKSLVAMHILTGAAGLVSFWVPVAGRKGGVNHRKWGRIFTWLMVVTGSVAVAMSLCTIAAPLATHPHLVGHAQFGDPRMITAVFGWMMLYLAVLTVNLAWYGWMCVSNKRNHAANRGATNLGLQLLLTVAAANCAWQGWKVSMPLMIGIAFVGFATVITNLRFILRDRPGPQEWLLEHVKALVGAGISVYTAFFAFGAVRLVPQLALTPVLWSIPLVVGLTLIVYHQRRLMRSFARVA